VIIRVSSLFINVFPAITPLTSWQVMELGEKSNQLENQPPHGDGDKKSSHSPRRNAWGFGNEAGPVSKKTVSFFDTGTKVDELAPFHDSKPPQGGASSTSAITEVRSTELRHYAPQLVVICSSASPLCSQMVLFSGKLCMKEAPVHQVICELLPVHERISATF